jgi:putative transposase
MLRRVICEYAEHYHFERTHQGLDNKLIIPKPVQRSTTERIQNRSRLGGMLQFYQRAAA